VVGEILERVLFELHGAIVARVTGRRNLACPPPCAQLVSSTILPSLPPATKRS
jgi:hypothetical protein